MENLKIEVNRGSELRESLEIQDLFIELGYKSKNAFNGIENYASCFYVADESGRFWSCGAVKFNNIDAKQVSLPELRNIVAQKREQPATSLNNIARTAEDHRENNLSNELNDLCNEFGCLPGNDRMWWLRDQLTKAAPFNQQETLYHYAASINTARGTVAYDGVITFPGRITGMEDYQQARAEIAKDGNVAPEQVNIHSLSIIS